MSNDLIPNESVFLQNAANMIEVYPSLIEDTTDIKNTFEKLPLSRLSALGTAFEPIASVVQKVFGNAAAKGGLYKVTIPNGTHLAEFKSGVGNLGSVLNSNDQLVGQAVLNPIAINPATIFMAATLLTIEKKLDAIQELQKEMMDFLILKEKSELRGNLIFLSDILNNYRYNWNNDMFKNNNHMKVLDIRQAAEQKILFYTAQIAARLKKKSLFHSSKDAQNQIDDVRAALKEYQLALYTHAFSSFLDVMLVGNFASGYLHDVSRKIDGYSLQYRELYTKCYDSLEAYYETSVESTFLKGLKNISKATGEAIAKVPVISKGQVDEALIEAGSRLDKFETQRSVQNLRKLVDHQSSCVKPFVENIETVDRLYNNSLQMIFDQENVYLGTEEKN